MKRVIAGIFLTLSIPLTAFAQPAAFMRGIDLLSMCRMEDHDSFCESYVAGIVDYHNLLSSLNAEPPVTFCIPEQYSIQQVTEIVLNDLANSPQHDNFIAAPAVTLALFKAFPCKT